MQETLHMTHLMKLLDKMYTYEIDPNRTARTRDVGQMDSRMSETNIAPQQLCCAGVTMMTKVTNTCVGWHTHSSPGSILSSLKQLSPVAPFTNMD